MATEDPSDLDRIDQEIRINELKHEAAELAGHSVTGWEADGVAPDLAEQFWRHVVEYEKAPWTTHFQQLEEAGVDLPAPDALDERALRAKLGEVINALAQLRVFLSNTNHLSDRALYAQLWHETLREQVAAVPMDDAAAWHLDLLSSGSAEDILLHLKYYADEEWRREWAEQFPGDEIPPHEDPPYDRDRHLPQSTYDRRSRRGDRER
jgi:hypothetical protein